jgi:hypothetical protein
MTETKATLDARAEADREINEQFHALLRDAAEKRDGRSRVHSSEDVAEAKQESADLLALAREIGRAAVARSR